MNSKEIILTPFVAATVVLYHTLKEKNPNTVFIFTDNSPKLQGKKYDGIEIASAQKAKAFHGDAKVIICHYMYAVAIRAQYQKLGFNDIENDLNLYLSMDNIKKILSVVNHDEMVNISPSLENGIDEFIFQYKNFFKTTITDTPGLIIINGLGQSLTQRCSLRCKDCVMGMQYYSKPVDYSIETNKRTFDLMMDKVDVVRMFSILGGEPFLYKELSEFIEYINTGKYIDRIIKPVVITNGTIVPDEKTLQILSKYSTAVQIADYGNARSIKVDELILNLQKYDIPIIRKRNLMWHSMCKIIDGENVSDETAQKRFEECEMIACKCISNGKLFFCQALEYFYNLNACPDDPSNYIDLTDESVTKEDVREYLSKKDNIESIGKFFPGCRWCSGCRYDKMPVEAAIQTREVLSYKKYK